MFSNYGAIAWLIQNVSIIEDFKGSEVMGKNIGKLVPSSKRMIKWGLIINMKKVEIMLKHSTISGKRLIRVTEVVIHESRGVRCLVAC